MKDDGEQRSLGLRYRLLLQEINKKMNGDSTRALKKSTISAVIKDLRKMALNIKHTAIDEDYPEDVKLWSSIGTNDQQYYQLLFEEKAAKKGIKIFLCKRMWCARNMLQETFKSSNYITRRSVGDMEVSVTGYQSLL